MPLDGFRILSAPISEHMGFLSFEVSMMFLNNFFFYHFLLGGEKKEVLLGKQMSLYKKIP